MKTIDISAVELTLAALLMLVNFGISAALRLGLGKSLAIGSLRMTVQLLLLGMVLGWVFSLKSPLLVLALCAVMTTVAGVSAVGRTRRRFASIYWNSLVSVAGAAFLVTGLAVAGIIRVRPPYEPQYLIPLLGMVLGNTLNGISLALDRFMEVLDSDSGRVEMLLALGATRWEAAHEAVRESLRTAMIPTVNSMMVMGIVSLPGMMTGQILAGADPTKAVRYQIVIMFMIASATALGAIAVVLFAFGALFDADHRLRLDRLTRRP